MLERYQSLLDRLKKEEKKQHIGLDFLQSLFEMQDVNKWLKFNAVTEIQIERAEHFENKLQELLEKLYAPQPQIENV